MMLSLLSNGEYVLYFGIVLSVIVSIVLHELGHGIAAISRGDRTPIELERMTLNPMVHMGGFSIVLLLVVGIAFGAMPINPSRMRGKFAEAFVAAAGPAVNLVLGVLAAVALGLWIRFGGYHLGGEGVAANGQQLLHLMSMLNFALLMFNLLPVPPLDGSRILANFYAPYRNFINGEYAQGVMLAMFFVVFFYGAQYLFAWAMFITDRILHMVTGSGGAVVLG